MNAIISNYELGPGGRGRLADGRPRRRASRGQDSRGNPVDSRGCP